MDERRAVRCRPGVGKSPDESHDTCSPGYVLPKIRDFSGKGPYALSELDEFWLRTLA
jgi:hypothetical protein